jgi:hypothetical protein
MFIVDDQILFANYRAEFLIFDSAPICHISVQLKTNKLTANLCVFYKKIQYWTSLKPYIIFWTLVIQQFSQIALLTIYFRIFFNQYFALVGQDAKLIIKLILCQFVNYF